MENLQPRRKTRFSPTGNGKGPSVSAIMSDLFTACRREQNLTPTEIAASCLRAAEPGTRSKTTVAAVSVLIIRGFEDAEIIDCLEPVYRSIMADKGASAKPLARIVCDARRRMSERAAEAFQAASELDATLNTASWSIFR
jgi:hypothetical protein